MKPAGQIAALARFYGLARRRLLLRSVLRAALWSGGANLLALGAMAAANRLFGLAAPLPYFAVVLFAVLLARDAPALRRGRLARSLDERFALKDRLLTVDDLARRRDVDPDFRAAQLDETCEAIRRLEPRSAFAIHPLHWLGPPLFVALLVAANVNTDLSMPPFVARIVRRDPGRGVQPQPVAQAPEEPPGAAPDRAEPAKPPDERPPPTEPREEKAPARDSQRRPTPETPRSRELFPPPPPKGAEKGSGAAGGPGWAARGVIPEPAQLFSETVTASLTPVQDRSREAGAADGAERPAPAGRITFNLVPRSASGSRGSAGGAAAGGAAGGGAAELEITVDFDAVPPEHRELVRRYFDGLSRGEGGQRSGS